MTYQANRPLPRHGWLHLTPAYAADLVSEILSDIDPQAQLLDPFSGSGTTVIRAAQLGLQATGWDINPFLLELVRAKSLSITAEKAASILHLGQECLQQTPTVLCDEPPMHNVERWWPAEIRLRLRSIKSNMLTIEMDASTRILLRQAFAACVKASAQVDHRHHSLSFSDAAVDCVIDEYFMQQLELFCRDCQDALPLQPKLLQHDARSVRADYYFDHVLCSPPYPNRMSYIRELRPYMYWLDYVSEAHECADLDWLAIGGTWGTATNRLKTWQAAHNKYLCPSLLSCLDAIPQQGSSDTIKHYIRRYTHDIYDHFESLKFIMRPGAQLDYIIGNAFYYGVEYPSDRIYMELLDMCGYQNIESVTLRRRSSCKALYEYRIRASAPGSGCCSGQLLQK